MLPCIGGIDVMQSSPKEVKGKASVEEVLNDEYADVHSVFPPGNEEAVQRQEGRGKSLS
jgi:hypothetical protein